MTQKEDLSVGTFFREVYSKTNVPTEFNRERDTLYFHARANAFNAFRNDLFDRVKADAKYTETEEMKKVLEKPGDQADQ